MKGKKYFSLTGLVLLAVFMLQAFVVEQALAQKHYKELTYPPLKKIKIPEPTIVTLDNGMKLFLVEDHEFPFINISARIRTGSVYDPPDKVGLADMTAQVMRTGGTTHISGDQLDEELEKIGASIETWMDVDMGGASVNTLNEYFDPILNYFADVLMNPAFPEEKIELAKIERRSMISRRNDDPNAIINREFQRLIYGKDSPYARIMEYEHVDAITRDDMVAFHRQFYHPNRVILGVWGDFKTKEMIQKIKNAFKDWKPTDTPIPPLPPVDYTYRKSVNLIVKKDVNQSKIRIGHLGGLLNSPDYPALVMMNQVLSGGFYSRLFSRVRSDQGLAYDPYGRYGANFSYPGIFFMNVSTKSSTTVKAIRSLLKELKEIATEKVTDEELAAARDSYLNSWVFRFDNKGEIINRLLTYAYYDYPLNFMETLRDRIEQVTTNDILEAARRNLHPDEVQILVVGNPDEFDEPLSVLGEVHEIDIPIPMPKTEAAPAASEEALKTGKEKVLEMMKAMGGQEKLQTIKTYRAKAVQTQVTPMGEMEIPTETLVMYPDKMLVSMQTPGGEMKLVLSGESGWMISPQGKMPAPAQLVQSLKEGLARSPFYLARRLDEASLQFIGESTLNEQPVWDILVTLNDYSYHLYLDREELLPAGLRYSTVTQQGPAEVEEYFSDWQEVQGLKVNFHSVGKANGEKAFERKVESIDFNVALDENIFNPQ